MSVQDHALDAVLRELVASVRAILGDSFCGAYLQGSFALGGFDDDSDVDFVVVTHDEVTDAQLAALQAMHRRIYALPSPWAQHLEGSYVTKDRLRRLDPSRTPWLYLDNGATELVRDDHCNTAVVRWILREHGVVLAGPDPRSLVDPVSADQLRAEVSAAMRDWAEWAREPHPRFGPGAMSRRQQSLLVLSFCRMLHTLESGRVTSKPEAGEWALRILPTEWRSLIRRALDDRPEQWRQVHEQADPQAVERTLAFADYVSGAWTRQ
ncbi:MAG TPA: aminoglycoside adenylyltransferase domain-containing protein [Gaiellaceae bacterium]|nr:aminoglycoside adenylyltransferase domain-containing protein [Gaiellaceae bacterium]